MLFVATANTLQDIPEPLRDRMEVIRLPGYLRHREAGDRHAVPLAAAAGGATVSIRSEVRALPGRRPEVIERYTREAGVRELDRRLSRIARKLARADRRRRGPPRSDRATRRSAGAPRPPPYHPADRDQDDDRVGIANGLAWTAAGGEILDVEVAIVPGSGQAPTHRAPSATS